ncbi:MAG: CoA transferase [Acidobacteria bacterium]|nr:CoA transferase [Acidobacteriota bacterium]
MPGPMDGYKIVDLTQVVSGPLATMLLADQGAEVVKVEPLGMGDVLRVPAFAKAGIGALFVNCNRGKQSVAIDLQDEAGLAVVIDLVRDADVFVENFRPGACERLGLGYDALKAVNPDLIYVSISGYGPTGPFSDRPVLDPVIQGMTGIIERQINPEIPFPDLVRNLIADKSTALTVAQAITAALLVREKGGGGQLVEIPMLDATLYFFWPDGMMDLTMLDEDASPGIRLSTVYSLTETADGKIVYFALTDKHRHGLFRALNRPELIEDDRFATMAGISVPENFAELGKILAAAFVEIPKAEILAKLAEHDVPAGEILAGEEVLEHPQVVHNECIVTWEHPEAGEIRQPLPAARFSKTPAVAKLSASALGADNDVVLGALGRSSDEIAAMRAAGTLL